MTSIHRPGWRLRLSDGMYAVDVSPPPECATMVHLRGEIAAGAEFFGVVATRDALTESVDALARRLASSLGEGRRVRRVDVAGSEESYRLDGTIDMEEGLAEDGIERIVTIVARGGTGIVSLTLRTRPTDAVGGAVDAVVASFELTGESPPDEPSSEPARTED